MPPRIMARKFGSWSIASSSNPSPPRKITGKPKSCGRDPRIAHLRSSDQRFAKVADLIDHGQAQKANTADASDFLRAALPLIANNSPFVLGTMGESGTMQWIVPPEEPVDKEEQAKEKNRPPDAPTLRHKSEPKP